MTLLDENVERLNGIQRIWNELGLDEQATFVHQPDLRRLPFDDHSFDMVWAWAALWLPPSSMWF